MSDAVIGLIGVIIGALLISAKDFLASFMSRRKNGAYLAIRVISILDRYVEGCANVVSDDGLYHGETNSDGYRQIQSSVPEFEVQSLDVDWKSISANIMYEILSFPNQIDAANHRIQSVFEYAATPPDYDDGIEERQYQYAVLGLKASNIADRLRTAYGVPMREYCNWNPIEYLKEMKQKIDKIQEKRNEQAAKFADTLNMKN